MVCVSMQCICTFWLLLEVYKYVVFFLFVLIVLFSGHAVHLRRDFP